MLHALLQASGGRWTSLACRCVTLVSASILTWASLLWASSLLFLGWHQWLDLGPSWIQYDLFLISYICQDPISEYGHILSFQTDMHFGETLFNPVPAQGVDFPRVSSTSLWEHATWRTLPWLKYGRYGTNYWLHVDCRVTSLGAEGRGDFMQLGDFYVSFVQKPLTDTWKVYTWSTTEDS